MGKRGLCMAKPLHLSETWREKNKFEEFVVTILSSRSQAKKQLDPCGTHGVPRSASGKTTTDDPSFCAALVSFHESL
jgi:hypothetical protein